MNTEKITRLFNDAVSKINNVDENSKSGVGDYWIDFYANMNADNLKRNLITKNEANEIANMLREYKKNGFRTISNEEEPTINNDNSDVIGDSYSEEDKLTQKVNKIINSIKDNSSNDEEIIAHLNYMIEYYTSLSGDNMKREGIVSYDDAREIAKRLTEYKNNLLNDIEDGKEDIKPVSISKKEEPVAESEPKKEQENETKVKDEVKREDVPTPKSETTEKDNNSENKTSRIKVVGKRVCKWISNHKRQILIGVGCAAMATGIFAIAASAIPTLMAANSANWWIAKSIGNVALMNTLHANNIALGAKIGAVFAAKTGTWTISTGAILGKSALVSTIAGVSGFGVSSVAHALHKKFVPKVNSDGKEMISKEEAKIYYDKAYEKGLRKGRKEANDEEYNSGYDDGYEDALDDIEREKKDNEKKIDEKDAASKSKVSFNSLRNGLARLFDKSKRDNDVEWEPIAESGKSNDRASLSERDDWQEHFANNGVEVPGEERDTVLPQSTSTVADSVAKSVESFMNDQEHSVEVPTVVTEQPQVEQESSSKKVSLKKSTDTFDDLAKFGSDLLTDLEKSTGDISSYGFVYNKGMDNGDDIWTIAHRAGGYYVENRDKGNIKAEIENIKDKLKLDTPDKISEWQNGFNSGVEDYNNKYGSDQSKSSSHKR